jgi:hypothetical protein
VPYRYPQEFAAIVPPPRSSRSHGAASRRLGQLPVRASQTDEDPVAPCADAAPLRETLNAAGGSRSSSSLLARDHFMTDVTGDPAL